MTNVILHFKGQSGTDYETDATLAGEEYQNVARGQSETLQIRFDQPGNEGSYGENFGTDFGGDSARYLFVRQFVRANSFTVSQSGTSDIAGIVDRQPPGLDPASMVLGVESDGLDLWDGAWYLVTSGEDITRYPRQRGRIDLEVTPLSNDFATYADVDAVLTDLEAEL